MDERERLSKQINATRMVYYYHEHDERHLDLDIDLEQWMEGRGGMWIDGTE